MLSQGFGIILEGLNGLGSSSLRLYNFPYIVRSFSAPSALPNNLCIFLAAANEHSSLFVSLDRVEAYGIRLRSHSHGWANWFASVSRIVCLTDLIFLLCGMSTDSNIPKQFPWLLKEFQNCCLHSNNVEQLRKLYLPIGKPCLPGTCLRFCFALFWIAWKPWSPGTKVHGRSLTAFQMRT